MKHSLSCDLNHDDSECMSDETVTSNEYDQTNIPYENEFYSRLHGHMDIDGKLYVSDNMVKDLTTFVYGSPEYFNKYHCCWFCPIRSKNEWFGKDNVNGKLCKISGSGGTFEQAREGLFFLPWKFAHVRVFLGRFQTHVLS